MPRTAGYMVILPGPEFDNVPNALEAVGRSLPVQLRRVVNGEAEDLAKEAARVVRRLPIRGTSGKHTGMRRRVAQGVHVQDRGRGDVRITTSMPRRSEAIIPRGLDRRAGWRHPVYGNKNNWVRQRPVRPGWFTDTIADGRDSIQNGLEDQLEQAAHRVAAAGVGP